jgi:hypothetical protein
MASGNTVFTSRGGNGRGPQLAEVTLDKNRSIDSADTPSAIIVGKEFPLGRIIWIWREL